MNRLGNFDGVVRIIFDAREFRFGLKSIEIFTVNPLLPAMAPQVQCDHCGKYFKALGIARHTPFCKSKKATEARNREVAAELLSDPQCTDLIS